MHEPLEVADERLGAAVELLVEALDDVLLEDAGAGPLAVGAAKGDFPVRRARLLPLDGVDELGVAVRADVQVASACSLLAVRTQARCCSSKYTTSIVLPEGRTTRRT